MSKRKKAPKFTPGDVVYRLWESGVKTLGIITDDYRFEALESYEDEGKVTVGETYGLGSFEYELAKQETLEEAAEKCRKKWLNDQSISINNIFSEGANWQAKRMYSLDHMRQCWAEAFQVGFNFSPAESSHPTFKDFIEKIDAGIKNVSNIDSGKNQ